MVVHSASCFMQQIVKKRFQHTNYVCFDAYKAKYVHTTTHDFLNMVQRFIEIASFFMGNSPAYLLTNITMGAPASNT